MNTSKRGLIQPGNDRPINAGLDYGIGQRLLTRLAGVPLLDGLSRHHRTAVLSRATYRKLFAHSVVTHQDEPSNYLFLILQGAARHFFVTSRGEKVLLLWLGSGKIFGASALLRQASKYLVGTEMIEDSHVAVWSRATIRQLLTEYPALGDNALSVASDYLTWYVASHAALLCGNAQQRVAHVLSTLSNGFGRQVTDGIELRLSNEELASAANVTPFTASRLINLLQRSGVLTKSRGKILLRDVERLFLQRP